ncbi:MAG TPA: amylo-alpha-1,6-glucosidase [Vicinamibacterales bacterium]|jgi:glycogen debranching enzyme|nr:amylo-alpha-1,6-glucosidase [Vicinamibacterales bacterium]
MEEVIQVQDQFYILATASKATERSAVLQHNDTFALFDLYGDVGAFGISEQGLYHEGTRYLSRFRLRMNGQRPLLLSARVKDDNELFGADLTNPDIPFDGDQLLLRDLVHLFRSRFLWNGAWHECIRLWNYNSVNVPLTLSFDIASDFADIFEVRGTPRERRGVTLEPVLSGREMRLGYRGLDDEARWAVIEWSARPQTMTSGSARFTYDLEPHTPVMLSFAIRCEREHRTVAPMAFSVAQSQSIAKLEEARGGYASVETSSERFNLWIRRAAADLRMLIAATPQGDYPYAGVPWFSTPFGRDGIITGLQTLWVNPRIARGVLRYLAATQADAVNEQQDAEPGKILHETRTSEMARLGEVPFGRYYGSVDATPLFIILAGEYFTRTGDRAFLQELWPHVERAMNWIDRYGDRDGDGFIEYAKQSPYGLVQQGWKDSKDAVFHADGSFARAPIALCEVQAYVYDARLKAARMAEALGDLAAAQRLRDNADRLRAAFEKAFWCETESTYALALDGDKRPCRVRTSNAGHCLFGGIASPEHARRTAETLAGPEMFSGWGIRTVSSVESRYNPMSYHNGSVWPHDNGLIAAGFARYRFDDLVAAPFGGLFEASTTVEGHRLPELFCGFHRRQGEGPTLYPVACSPQAWASGVVFHLLQSCLHLSVNAEVRELSIDRPMLPPFLTYVRVLNLELPFGDIDLLFEQQPLDVAVTVLRRRGSFEVRIIKSGS